jgi:hypothetical protein
MTEFRLGEVYCALVKAKLQAGMPAHVAAINAEATDGLVIDTPSDEDYFTSGIGKLPHFPAVIVVEGPSNFSAEGPESLMADALIGVYIYERDSDRQVLGYRLQRLARAVVETICLDDPQYRLDDNAFRIFPQRTIPGRVFEPDQQDSFASFYIVEFAATALEG